jgi:hypothetical protein
VAALLMQILDAAVAAQVAYNETQSPPLQSYEGGHFSGPFWEGDRYYVSRNWQFQGRVPLDMRLGTGQIEQ